MSLRARWLPLVLIGAGLGCIGYAVCTQRAASSPEGARHAAAPDVAPAAGVQPLLRVQGRPAATPPSPVEPSWPNAPANSPAASRQELIDTVYELPVPAAGRVWISAHPLFDATIRRGTQRPLMSWPPTDFGGRARRVIEVLRENVVPASWGAGTGTALQRQGDYKFRAKTTEAVHAKIEHWLEGLLWTAAPTARSVVDELVWMLEHGTEREQGWADDALARVPATVRDAVEQKVASVPPASKPQAAASAGPRLFVRLEAHLLRMDRRIEQDLGIDLRGSFGVLVHARFGTEVSTLDDLHWVLIERVLKKSTRIERVARQERILGVGAKAQLALGESAVLHVRADASKDLRYVKVQARAHAMHGGSLLFVPRFDGSVPDQGSFLIRVRNVLAGVAPAARPVAIALRVTIVDAAGRPIERPAPVQPVEAEAFVPVRPLPDADDG